MSDVSIKRLNMLVNCAMHGIEPKGPLTSAEAESFAKIKAQVEAHPGVAYCGVFEG